MNWEEIITRHANEYKEYLAGYKQGQDQLKQDKAMLLKHVNCKESELSSEMRNKLDRDEEGFKQEWGMYGNRFKNMRISHQKEVDKFFRQQEITQDMEQGQEKRKERDKGASR